MSILRRIANLFRRSKLDEEIDTELCSHIEMRTADNIAAGMTPKEARRQAVLRFGSRPAMEERVIAADAHVFLDTLWHDVRYGLRQLRCSPGFTAVAILTLAVGLAANTAIFSVINGVLLQPLEYPNPGQLVALQLLVPQWEHKFPMVPLNPATYLAWSRQGSSLAGITVAETGETMNLTGAGEPALLTADAVTSTLFDVLGVKPLLGRTFSPDSDQAGHNHEAILTNALWRNRFNGDPNIIGRAIALDGSAYTVSASLAAQRFETLLTSLFAAAALLLGCLGIYGVVSYSVVRRTHEIGVRMALGAQKTDVLRRIFRQGMKSALFGLAIGIIGALGFVRFLSSLLFEVKPTDPLTLIVVSLILTAVAALACYIPARRAMRVDPMVALRYE